MYVFLIECDPGNTLGGSCIRDLVNTAYHLNCPNINVFTTNPVDKSKFPSQCSFHKFERKPIEDIVSTIPNNTTIFVLISGHGYQIQDKTNNELDGMDEYIKTKTTKLLDNDLRDIFILPLQYKKNVKFVGLIDTCHSGSMFDLDYMYNGNTWVIDTKRKPVNVDAVSIGACRDNQLDNCDIGNIGFGGSLTVHMIDNNLMKDMVDKTKHITIFEKMKKILGKLHQTPVLQKCNNHEI